jgi:hypothetical protein
MFVVRWRGNEGGDQRPADDTIPFSAGRGT